MTKSDKGSAGKTGAPADKLWVYLFRDLDRVRDNAGPETWEDIRALLGGKGANLAQMTSLGLPVPAGFTVTTEACNAFMDCDRNFPRRHVGAGS